MSYGLIDINSETSSLTVQQISDAVTHARFVGTDSSSDEVFLMKILHVCPLFNVKLSFYWLVLN